MPDRRFVLPYRAQSPSTLKTLHFKKKQDVDEEIDRLLNEKGTKKFGAGQSLFLQLPFFCDPINIIPEWCWEMISDYQVIKDYNIPLAKTLDSADVFTLDCFNVIKQEINNISIYQRKQNGN